MNVKELSAVSGWISIKENLPACNMLVKVKLTNGTEALDFVNEPVDNEMPFQHYIVSHWRTPTRDELNAFIQRANRDSQ